MNLNHTRSLSHTKWNCKYHIVFAPKYSSIMIYEKWGSLKYKYRGRQFWCRGYYVDTAGKNTKAIQEYIQNQLKEDELSGQITMDNIDPFRG